MSTAKSAPPSARQIFNFLSFYFLKTPWAVAAAYACMTVLIVCDMLGPVALAWLVDVSAESVVQKRNLYDLLQPVLAVIVLSIVARCVYRAANIINCYTDSRVEAEVVADAIKHVHSFETEWHTNTFAGSIVTAIKRGRSAAHHIFDIFCYDLYGPVLAVLISLVMTWQRSPTIALVLFAYALILFASSLVLSLKFVSPKRRIYAAEDSRLGGSIADSVSGYAAVKAAGAEEFEFRRIQRVANQYALAARTTWIRSSLLVLVQTGIVNFGRAIALGLAALYWTEGLFSPGDVMFVVMMQRQLNDYFENLGNRVREVFEAFNDIEEVVNWRLRQPAIVGATTSVAPRSYQLELQQVTFSYHGQPTPAIKDISLTIAPGERVAIVGRTGSGKSTLFKLLHRVYETQHGDITLGGHSIKNYPLPELRRQLALVSQEPVLFHRSLAENIAYAKPHATLEEIKRAAQLAHISELIDSLPNGYETLVGERGVKLSGGERQRVALARAILADAKIILLDEATSALDNQTEQLIQKALAEVALGRSVLAIAHRISTIQDFDRIVVLERGEIVEMGSHQELVEQGGVYARLCHSGEEELEVAS